MNDSPMSARLLKLTLLACLLGTLFAAGWVWFGEPW